MTPLAPTHEARGRTPANHVSGLGVMQMVYVVLQSASIVIGASHDRLPLPNNQYNLRCRARDCHALQDSMGVFQAGGGGGVSAKCEVMGFCLKLATSKKGGGLPLLPATEIFQNEPQGVTLDVHKWVFVHFWGMKKEIWGCFASKMTDLCTLS